MIPTEDFNDVTLSIGVTNGDDVRSFLGPKICFLGPKNLFFGNETLFLENENLFIGTKILFFFRCPEQLNR